LKKYNKNGSISRYLTNYNQTPVYS